MCRFGYTQASAEKWTKQLKISMVSEGSQALTGLRLFGLYVPYSVKSANITEHLQGSAFKPRYYSEIWYMQHSLIPTSLQKLPPGAYLSNKQTVCDTIINNNRLFVTSVNLPVSPSIFSFFFFFSFLENKFFLKQKVMVFHSWPEM